MTTADEISRRVVLAGMAGGTMVGSDAHAGPAATGHAVRGTRPVPFRVGVPDRRLAAIRSKVAAFDWDSFADPARGSDWSLGPPPAYLRDLCAYWVNTYDWRAQERLINVAPQFTAVVDGFPLHFVHKRGSGPRPRPLLILHGWPYSFHSYTPLLARLAHPERFGGRVEDAFSVVVPSLPGYAFSGRPQAPMGPRVPADLMHRLMTETLGYDRYLVHGGDWGGYMASLLGLDHPDQVAGVHTTMVVVRSADPPTTAAEKAFAASEAAVWQREGAYAKLEETRPLSLTYAMADSPVGVVAYIVEKYHAWSDRRARPFEALFTRDQLLTEVMLYLVDGAFNTSVWMAAGDAANSAATLPHGVRVTAPTAVAAFPDPVFPPPPRETVNRSHNLVRYTDMPRGGHYPFYEAPDLLIDDLRAFNRMLHS